MRHAARSACLAASALLAGCAGAPGEAGAQATASVPAISQLTGSKWWSEFLAHSKELGPARAQRASVVVELRGPPARGAVAKWAALHHLSAKFYAGGQVAVLRGSAGELGKCFSVQVDLFRASGGQHFVAAGGQPSIPTRLKAYVTGIGRVSSYEGWQDDYVPGGGLTPSGLLEAYDASALRAKTDGAGETVVAFEIDGYSQRDLDDFVSRYKLPAFFSGSNRLVVHGGEAGAPQGETDMDLETLREIAPAAKLVYFNLLGVHSGSTSATMVTAFSQAAKDWPGAIWSLSLGLCEKLFGSSDLDALDKVVATAEGKGTTVFAASGDSAGLECTGWDTGSWGSAPTSDDVGVQVPAVLPSVTGVGGTALSVTRSGAYSSEVPWYYPALGQGTGGGVSTVFAQPSWQVAPGLPQPSSSQGREVPDVAALAAPVTGNAIIEGGEPSEGNGTSLATPVWAGFTALDDAYLHSLGARPVGFANPALYYLADHKPPEPPFHVVSGGGNEVYLNGSGYSPTTGLGSPDVWDLARDLAWLQGKYK
jgi:kumamolisin